MPDTPVSILHTLFNFIFTITPQDIIITIPIFQMRKMRLRKLRYFVLCHTSLKVAKLGFQLRLPESKVHILTSDLCAMKDSILEVDVSEAESKHGG